MPGGKEQEQMWVWSWESTSDRPGRQVPRGGLAGRGERKRGESKCKAMRKSGEITDDILQPVKEGKSVWGTETECDVQEVQRCEGKNAEDKIRTQTHTKKKHRLGVTLGRTCHDRTNMSVRIVLLKVFSVCSDYNTTLSFKTETGTPAFPVFRGSKRPAKFSLTYLCGCSLKHSYWS